MARISDAVLQGLMNPRFGFTGLAEPIGMLMGGAQAQRQAQQRQMQAIQGALGAQDIGGLQEVLKGLKPDEVQNVLAVYGVGQKARAQEAAATREQRLRDAVASSAPSLGPSGKELARIAPTLSYEELQKQYSKIYEKFGSVQGVLSAYGIPPDQWGKYENLSATEVRAIVKDLNDQKKATPKVYIDSAGNTKTYLTNAVGAVNINGEWVDFPDTGLNLAPNRVQTQVLGDFPPTLDDVLGKPVTSSFLDRRESAYEQVGVLENNALSSALLKTIPEDETNLLANITNLGRDFLIAFGVADEETIENNANLKAFLVLRGQAVAQALASGIYGTSTAISDADREAAKSVSGQDITLTRETIMKILYLERKLAYAKIERHNKDIDKVLSGKEINGKPASEAYGSILKVDAALPPDFYTRPENWQKTTVVDGERLYLDWVGVTRREDGTIVPTRKR